MQIVQVNMHLVLSLVVQTYTHLLEDTLITTLIYAFINLCWPIIMLLAFVCLATCLAACRSVDLFRRYHSLPPSLPRAVSAFYAEEFMINISNDEEKV